MELADSFAVDRLVTSHVAALLTMLSAESFPVGPSVPSPLAAPDRCLLMCLLFLVPFLLLIKIQPPCFVNMRLPLRLQPPPPPQPPSSQVCVLLHPASLQIALHTGRNWHYAIEIFDVGMMKIQSGGFRQCETHLANCFRIPPLICNCGGVNYLFCVQNKMI